MPATVQRRRSYAQSLEAAFPEEYELDEVPLEDCWNTVRTANTSASENILGHVEWCRWIIWFDEKCQQVLNEKNASWEPILRQTSLQNVERYRQKQTQLFRETKRRQEEEESEELKQLYCSHETR